MMQALESLLIETGCLIWRPKSPSLKRLNWKNFEDLSSVSRAFWVCFLPENLELSDLQEALIKNLIRALSIKNQLSESDCFEEILIVMGASEHLAEASDFICRKAGAVVALGFGVKLPSMTFVQSVSTLPLDDVMNNPLLKRQVWEDVRFLSF